MTETMDYLASDFARCASNPLHVECSTCLRNVNISPVKPDTIATTTKSMKYMLHSSRG